MIRHKLIASILVATNVLCLPAIGQKAHAQSEASVVLSALPVASVVVAGVGASTAAGAVVAAPVVLSTAGAVLVVKAIEVTARGTVYVLESASDATRVSIELSGKAANAASVGVGTSVVVTVIASGTILAASGQAIAFLPNALGRALLHNERITR
jgi:hypothetical protein